MDHNVTPPVIRSQANHSWIAQTSASLFISIPLYLLSAAVFTAGFLFYYAAPSPNNIDWQLANDLLADSGNLQQNKKLDEALLKSRKIVITTDVNPHLCKQIIASLILLNQQDPKQPIDLYLRTEGGWVSDAFAVVDTMKAISAPVNVYALGGTHSAGAIILIGASGKRVGLKNSIIMIHDNLAKPDGSRFGSDQADNHRLKNFYRLHAQFPDSWFKEFGDQMYYLNSEQALAFGILDEIVEKF